MRVLTISALTVRVRALVPSLGLRFSGFCALNPSKGALLLDSADEPECELASTRRWKEAVLQKR